MTLVMASILTILFVAFAIEAVAVVILKRGLDDIGARYNGRRATLSWWRNILALVGNWFTQRDVIIGVFLKAVFFVLLQYLIGLRDISFIWPLTALSFVMTTLTARFFLRERVNVVRWWGVALIVAGAALTSYSENNGAKPQDVSSVSTASGQNSLTYRSGLALPVHPCESTSFRFPASRLLRIGPYMCRQKPPVRQTRLAPVFYQNSRVFRAASGRGLFDRM